MYASVETETLAPLDLATPFPLLVKAPSTTAETFPDSDFETAAGGSSSIGESGGGGMSVPAVSEGSVARTGRSKRPFKFDELFVALGAEFAGIVDVELWM